MEGVEAPQSQANFEKMALSMSSELGMSSNQLKSVISKELYEDVIRIASNPAFQKSIDDTCTSTDSQTGGGWFKYIKTAIIGVLLLYAPSVNAGAAQAPVYARAARLRQQRLSNPPGSQQGGKRHRRRTKKRHSRRH